MTKRAKSCGYQGYEFGAGSYPDSVCVGGRLHDADHCDDKGRLYANDEDVPCPMCRPKDAIKWWRRRNGDDPNALINARNLVADIRRKRGAETK